MAWLHPLATMLRSTESNRHSEEDSEGIKIDLVHAAVLRSKTEKPETGFERARDVKDAPYMHRRGPLYLYQYPYGHWFKIKKGMVNSEIGIPGPSEESLGGSDRRSLSREKPVSYRIRIRTPQGGINVPTGIDMHVVLRWVAYTSPVGVQQQSAENRPENDLRRIDLVDGQALLLAMDG
ncbi:hypothetical protein BDN72DRAFT_877691 [Pluteus cervinus]|uniref:Uncharacterized protein n=1 Tax=Pluteus cervinus TaxID=181527 RepID=A0ACD3AY17_9AGAR|nr:hypothetical protein BDN72DRAFT_877691 [Pluteus cervinus]